MSRPQRTPGYRTPHSSISSSATFMTPQQSPSRIPSTPGTSRLSIPGTPRTSRLVLLHDDDSNDEAELSSLPLPEDEDESEDEQNAQSYTLSSNLVLLYLVSCSTRLGASMLSDLESHVSWRIILPVLLVVALVTLATTQVWIRMAHYVRKSSLADVVADGIVAREEHARQRKVVRSMVKLGGIGTNVLLCSVYMRSFLDTLLQLYSKDVGYALRVPVTLALALTAAACMGSTLRSKRVILSTAVSLSCYTMALLAMSFLRAKGISWPDPDQTEPRSLKFRIWESTSIILFAFTTPFVLPLYAVMARPSTVHSERKKVSQSFTAVSILWLVLSIILLVPLIFVSPGALRSTAHLAREFSPATVQRTVIFLRSFAVVAAMPSVTSILPTPNSNAFGFAARSRRIVWRGFFLAVMTLLALSSQRASRVFSGLAMLLSLIGSYVLPCILHIVHHYVRRPQAILVPTDGTIYTMYSPNGGSDDEDESEGLLQRKEDSLQRRRLARRIVWDVAVWLVILPLGAASLGWTGGRMVGRW
ncbi:hypothetical protein BKA62DRAFT_709592 [Auriculariales sp. MPI-PUGE-AT-0066]|nr:hypothetical protein BKA62DRAFT_709592 [Auriculariales sp. MPI-PUGE-AT-0066]